MRTPEDPLPVNENQAEFGNQVNNSEVTRGSNRWPNKMAIALTTLAVGGTLAGGLLGGLIIGECGAYAGGTVGLATGMTLAAHLSGFTHRETIS